MKDKEEFNIFPTAPPRLFLVLLPLLLLLLTNAEMGRRVCRFEDFVAFAFEGGYFQSPWIFLFFVVSMGILNFFFLNL